MGLLQESGLHCCGFVELAEPEVYTADQGEKKDHEQDGAPQERTKAVVHRWAFLSDAYKHNP